MNKGNYGFPLPPNAPTRVVPPRWDNMKVYDVAGSYNDFTVPQNVFQVRAIIIGAGASGAAMRSATAFAEATGGAAGAYADVILDVVPGQALPTITVGAGGVAVSIASGTTTVQTAGNSGGASSIGSILTCNGGQAGQFGGTVTNSSAAAAAGGTVVGSVRGYKQTGGNSGAVTISGSPTSVAGATGGASPFKDSGSVICTSAGAVRGAATGGAALASSGSISISGASNLESNATGGAGVYASGSLTSDQIRSGGGGSYGPSSGNVAINTGSAGGIGFAVAGGPAGSGATNGTNGSNSSYDIAWMKEWDFFLQRRYFSSGGGAYSNSLTTSNQKAGDGGMFGAGGGAVGESFANGSGTRTAGNGGFLLGAGGAIAAYGSASTLIAGNGGKFSGGGACAAQRNGDGSTVISAGNGGVGAGGGAVVAADAISTAAYTLTSGAGGNGLVILMWTEGY